MPTLSISDFKKGEAVLFKQQPHIILKIRSKHLGRGGAIYRVKLKNLLTGATLMEAMRATEKLETVNLSRRPLNFMYSDGDTAYFVNSRNYQQLSLPLAKIGDFARFLKEGEDYHLIFIDDQSIGLQPPLKIKREVVKAPPAVAGDTVNSPSKTVIIEGQIEIETPLFINAGDTIVIRTEDSSYIEKV